MSYVARLNNVRQVPLYRSSFALMLTTGLNGILGFAYWVLAARLYPAKAVGIGAGAISAMTLVSSLGWVGLQYVLLRYVPVAGRAQRPAWSGSVTRRQSRSRSSPRVSSSPALHVWPASASSPRAH